MKRSLVLGFLLLSLVAVLFVLGALLNDVAEASPLETGGGRTYYVCHVNARHNGQSFYNYITVGGLSGHFYFSNPDWPKHGGWFGNTFRWDFVTVEGDENCDGEPDDIPGCMDETAWNFNPEATVDDGSCVYDVCPNLEGLQETVPEGYVKPGRRCIPKPEPPPTCDDDSAYNFGDPLPCVYDVCPNLDGLQETVPEGYVKPGRRCIPAPLPSNDELVIMSDCEGWTAIKETYVGCNLIGTEVIASGKWSDKYETETATFTYEDEKIEVKEPGRCRQCRPEVFMWLGFSQGDTCALVEKGFDDDLRPGDPGYHTAPGVPFQEKYCGSCDNPWQAIGSTWWGGFVDECDGWKDSDGTDLDNFYTYERFDVERLKDGPLGGGPRCEE
jgi:hypothetical protein